MLPSKPTKPKSLTRLCSQAPVLSSEVNRISPLISFSVSVPRKWHDKDSARIFFSQRQLTSTPSAISVALSATEFSKAFCTISSCSRRIVSYLRKFGGDKAAASSCDSSRCRVLLLLFPIIYFCFERLYLRQGKELHP